MVRGFASAISTSRALINSECGRDQSSSLRVQTNIDVPAMQSTDSAAILTTKKGEPKARPATRLEKKR
jgi:hypothetical protein